MQLWSKIFKFKCFSSISWERDCSSSQQCRMLWNAMLAAAWVMYSNSNAILCCPLTQYQLPKLPLITNPSGASVLLIIHKINGFSTPFPCPLPALRLLKMQFLQNLLFYIRRYTELLYSGFLWSHLMIAWWFRVSNRLRISITVLNVAVNHALQRWEADWRVPSLVRFEGKLPVAAF